MLQGMGGWSRELGRAVLVGCLAGACSLGTRTRTPGFRRCATSFREQAIATLRHDAQAALGAKFDLRAFHEQVLAHGALTLPMLKEAVARWIATQR